MQGDTRINSDEAQHLHNLHWSSGCLVVWTVFDKPPDYPESIVARPSSITSGKVEPLTKVLLGPSVKAVVDQLPAGLTFLPPQNKPEEARFLVGTWI